MTDQQLRELDRIVRAEGWTVVVKFGDEGAFGETTMTFQGAMALADRIRAVVDGAQVQLAPEAEPAPRDPLPRDLIRVTEGGGRVPKIWAACEGRIFTFPCPNDPADPEGMGLDLDDEQFQKLHLLLAEHPDYGWAPRREVGDFDYTVLFRGNRPESELIEFIEGYLEKVTWCPLKREPSP